MQNTVQPTNQACENSILLKNRLSGSLKKQEEYSGREKH